MHAIGFGPRFVVNRRGVAAVAPVFDFSGGVLPAGATLRRASAATYTAASGALASVGADIARFDYRAARLRGLLLEPASSNALWYSADWTNAYWSRNNLGGDAGTLIESAGASVPHFVRTMGGGVDYTAGAAMTASAIASERGGSAKRYLLISLGSVPVFASSTFAIFDVATGAVTAAPGAAAAGTVALDGGAWLCWVSAVPVASASAQSLLVKLNVSTTTSASYVGDGASGLNAANVQAEPGGAATSRIATSGAVATRAGDALTLDWRSRGVADGSVVVRYGFDDGSTQDVATVVSSGTAVVPTSLARRWLVRAQKL